MSRLTDLLVEWAGQKKRWPLLLLLLIPAAFTLVREYYGVGFRQTLQHTPFLSTAAAIVLVASGLYLYLNYADRLRYSAWVNRRPGHPRIAVADAVAWQTLRYALPDGEIRSSTVVEELARLLAGLPYRVIVVPQRAIAEAEYSDEFGCEAFYVDGKVEGASVLLKAQMIISQGRVPEIVEDVMKNPEVGFGGSANEFLFVQARRFLRNPFRSSGFKIEVPLTPAMLPEHRTAVALLILRYTLATLLFYDRHPDADRLFREVMDTVRFWRLPEGNSAALAMIYTSIGYYFAVHRQRVDEALAALAVAERFEPGDVQIHLMQAYLCLASGRLSRAKELLESIAPRAGAHQLFHVLRGGHHMALQQFPQAIEAFETALRLDDPDHPDDKDGHGRAMLHLRIAIAYGQADHLPERQRAAEMIKHTEDAIGLEPSNPTYYVLQGFGWSLQKNEEMSRQAFQLADERVDRRRATGHPVQGCWRLGQRRTVLSALVRAGPGQRQLAEGGSCPSGAGQRLGRGRVDRAGATGRPDECESVFRGRLALAALG
jgi:tetratricopeptide (TPR) repeat protein